MSDVFISYARSTEPQAGRVHQALHDAGYDVWRDTQLPAHRAFSDVIEERLRAAKAVVVIWSAEAAKSHWVRAEADIGLNLGTLVQASVDGTGPPLPFNQFQVADLADWDGDGQHSGWRKLKDSVAALAGDRVREASLDKPSIAVLPFRILGDAGPHAFLAEALPHELIAEFARLRWLFVIARGSSFQFREAEPDIDRVRTVLGARYCLNGTIEIAGETAAISVELVDTRDGRLIWGERFSAPIASAQAVRQSIVASVVAALEIRLPDYEARAARSVAPERLDAWANYHLGLQHMFRFNAQDNEVARSLFERAVQQQPEFARAFSALSFVHFQNAFLHYRPDTDAEAKLAHAHAVRSLEIDELDPSSNSAMGRALWLTGDLETSLVWLDRAIQLSPNNAHALYARGWTKTLLGDGEAGEQDVDLAIALSPIDPLHYAMLGIKGLSHLVRGQDALAAQWTDRAARTPGAHILLGMIAATCQALAGDSEKARYWSGQVRSRSPDTTQAELFRSFPFRDTQVRDRMSSALASLGF